MKRRYIICFLTAFALIFMLCACESGARNTGKSANNSNAEVRIFKDSAGREVEVPKTIERVAPSGTYAQIMLYTLCPEKLTGLSSAFTRTQKKYVDEKYFELPVLGQFYGGSGTLNLEALIAAAPDIIIDIGEPKEGIAEDMDGLQEQSGIPAVFIEARLDNMAEAYDMLGELLNYTAKSDQMSAYIRDVFNMAEENNAKLSESDRLRVIYSQGEYGLEVNAAGSIHAEALDKAGAVNAAQLGEAAISGKGGAEVSIEQMLNWQPDVILLSPEANYDEIFTDPIWADVTAVQERRVYEVPLGMYNWLDRPPSVQRVLGVLWLGNLLYPQVYNYDMTKKAQEFYKLFFDYDLTEQEARELMAESTCRADRNQ